jgi:hypothetical protein
MSQGIANLEVSNSGELRLTTPLGTIVYSTPVAWQVAESKKIPIEISYNIIEDGYGFTIGEYDKSRQLFIDPLLNATYLGGGANDRPHGVAVHPSSGDVYVAGYTLSTDFPNVSAGWDSTKSGFQDAFIARFDSTLANLEVATYLGGSGTEQLSDYGGPVVAIHPVTGDILLTGFTNSTNFPNAVNTNSGSDWEAFIARLNTDLNDVPSSTYFGWLRNDYGTALAVNPDNGDIYLAGYTLSVELPETTGNFQTGNTDTSGLTWEGFVASFSSHLGTLNDATFLGGTGSDVVSGIAIYPSSSAYGTTEVCITGILPGDSVMPLPPVSTSASMTSRGSPLSGGVKATRATP